MVNRWNLCTLYLLACQVRVTIGFAVVFVWHLSGANYIPCVLILDNYSRPLLFQIMYIYKLWGHCFHILFRIYFIKHAFVVRSHGQFFCFQKHLLFLFRFFLSLLALAWNAHWYCDLWAAWLVKHGSNQMIWLKWKNSSHWGTYLFVWLLGHFSFTFLHQF